jgi:hypothetical protein
MMVESPGSMRQRALAVIQGKQPDRLPFITRLETWYKSHLRTETLPVEFREMSLPELHRSLNIGQLKFTVPFACLLRGVEVSVWFNGERIVHENDPVLENFPGMWDFVPTDRAGTTITELVAPAGRLRLQHMLVEENVLTGTDPYLKEHLIKDEADLNTVEYILERLEWVPRYANYSAEQDRLGENAFVVPLLLRIPFQQALLEYLGETALFYALYDHPNRIQRLLTLLDQQMLELLNQLSSFDVPYVEFPDNLHGTMTNPKLFREYCLPAYQKYTQVLHGQGKKVGSHTDGSVKPLLRLLAESGLDVCESFSPYPLTECRFEEAWAAWESGPVIWGGIPSPILEEDTPAEEFTTYMEGLFAKIDRPLILGVVDLFMRHNSIERVRQIAQGLENRRWQFSKISVPA